jgi:hypothetical protein
MIGLLSNGWPETGYSLDQIEQLGPEHATPASLGDYKVRTLKLRGGKLLDLGAHDVDCLLMRPVQLLAAEAGIGLCHWYLDDGAPELTTTPVIAWALCMDGEVRPVTPGGVDGGTGTPDGNCFVKMPDGRIRGVGTMCDPSGFPNETELLAYLVEEEATRAEHRRAAAAHAAAKAEEAA